LKENLILKSVLNKEASNNSHCCRKGCSTNSFTFQCFLVNIRSNYQRWCTLQRKRDICIGEVAYTPWFSSIENMTTFDGFSMFLEILRGLIA